MNPRLPKHLKQMLYITCVILLLPGCGKESTPPKPASPVETNIQFSGAAPEVLPSTLKVERQEKTYRIAGIGLKGDTKLAIINNSVVQPGEEIDAGVVLEDVQPTYATILVGNTRHLLRPEDIQRELDRKKLQ